MPRLGTKYRCTTRRYSVLAKKIGQSYCPTLKCLSRGFVNPESRDRVSGCRKGTGKGHAWSAGSRQQGGWRDSSVNYRQAPGRYNRRIPIWRSQGVKPALTFQFSCSPPWRFCSILRSIATQRKLAPWRVTVLHPRFSRSRIRHRLRSREKGAYERKMKEESETRVE